MVPEPTEEDKFPTYHILRCSRRRPAREPKDPGMGSIRQTVLVFRAHGAGGEEPGQILQSEPSIPSPSYPVAWDQAICAPFAQRVGMDMQQPGRLSHPEHRGLATWCSPLVYHHQPPR